MLYGKLLLTKERVPLCQLLEIHQQSSKLALVFGDFYIKYVCVHTLLGASQVALVVKNLPANAGDVSDASAIPGLGRSPGGGHGNPPQYSCLAGYSSWGCKESDRTDCQHTRTPDPKRYLQGRKTALHCFSWRKHGKQSTLFEVKKTTQGLPWQSSD